ncbi:alpha/beta hydrolase [Patescibacteria group bacterium]
MLSQSKVKHWAKRIIIDAVIIYVALLGVLFFTQSNYIYYPDEQDFEECIEFTDADKITQNGTRMYVTENNNPDTLVIFYHGNAGSACDRSLWNYFFNTLDVSNIFVEYAGYSNDPRTPSEELFYQDVQNVQEYIATLPYKRIIIVSESIGSGPATYHTTLTYVAELLLMTPFVELADVASYHYPIYPVRLLLKDKFDNVKNLSNFTGNLTLIHGEEDEIIPIHLGKQLFDEVKTQHKKFIGVPNADHDDIYVHSEVFDTLLDIILQ